MPTCSLFLILIQHSVKELRGLGIQPNMLVIRTEQPVHQGIKEKLANFCDVDAKAVMNPAM